MFIVVVVVVDDDKKHFYDDSLLIARHIVLTNYRHLISSTLSLSMENTRKNIKRFFLRKEGEEKNQLNNLDDGFACIYVHGVKI